LIPIVLDLVKQLMKNKKNFLSDGSLF